MASNDATLRLFALIRRGLSELRVKTCGEYSPESRAILLINMPCNTVVLAFMLEGKGLL